MRLIRKLLLSLLAILLIIEEWLWDLLTTLGSLLTRLLHLQRLELWLTQTPPRIALLAFIVPLLIVTPINLLGLGLIGNGLFLKGVAVEIFAKFLGTILIARVFKLTKNQLLTFRWFAWGYNKILSWLDWAHYQVTSTTVYRLAKKLQYSVFRRK